MLKLRRRTAQEPTVPPGADFAYEVAAARLDDQLGSVADLDRKLGVVIAIAGALLAALAQFANTRVGGESPLWVRAAASPGSPISPTWVLGLLRSQVPVRAGPAAAFGVRSGVSRVHALDRVTGCAEDAR